ncbi:cytochrome c, mono- and diheme variants family [Desulfosporosinus acidiphilus SJ4]|uniref:Cytochrome c, mono-and diheme variants family n=1 Tax=Desulfosporosinus acidiphilus (strain DSM 22704 / JCM 16185 / SJ4) TaxID=646529 RepID=I4D5N4_DESAJ|nr:cytochrome c [Desulfosporosinus acidiphilus]AFM41108.1 cytochrome c, mono- and diheme variants family [Desulfosporosinus acidiphilus SJ4]
MHPRKLTSIVTLLIVLLLIGCSKQPAPTTPPPAQTGQSTNTPATNVANGASAAKTEVTGATLYTTNCSGCHGVTGAGASGPAINTDEWKNNSSKVQGVVKKGQGTMPAFTGKLNDTQIKAIGDFVASLKK